MKARSPACRIMNCAGAALALAAMSASALAQGGADCPDFDILFSLDIGSDPLLPDVLYLNTFVGVDRYRSAFRDGESGTPLGRVGILFAAPGIGRYGSALASQPAGSVDRAGHPLVQADRSIGFALGYQMFFLKGRHQLIVEVAGRRSTADGVDNGVIGAGARYQVAIGQHLVLLINRARWRSH